MKFKIGDIITGKELNDAYDNIQDDSFASENTSFQLVCIDKKLLFDAPINCGTSANLKTFKQWLEDSDNYDFYHTDTIYEMVKKIRSGCNLPPIIVDANLGLYDGQHRLTAYSMLCNVTGILIFKQIEDLKD